MDAEFQVYALELEKLLDQLFLARASVLQSVTIQEVDWQWC